MVQVRRLPAHDDGGGHVGCGRSASSKASAGDAEFWLDIVRSVHMPMVVAVGNSTAAGTDHHGGPLIHVAFLWADFRRVRPGCKGHREVLVRLVDQTNGRCILFQSDAMEVEEEEEEAVAVASTWELPPY